MAKSKPKAKSKSKKSQARRTSTTPVKVLAYPSRGLIKLDADVVNGELFRAFLYHNSRIKILQDKYAKYRLLRASLDPRLSELEKERKRVLAEKRDAERLSSGRNNPETRERLISKAEYSNSPEAAHVVHLEERLKVLTEEIKEIGAAVEAKYFEEADAVFEARLSAEYKRATVKNGKPPGPWPQKKLRESVTSEMLAEKGWPAVWKEKVRNDVEAKRLEAKALKTCRVGPGTYLEVHDALKRSIRDSKGDPKVKYFDHRGVIAVQLVKEEPLTPAIAFSGKHSKVQLALATADEREYIFVFSKGSWHTRGISRSFKEQGEGSPSHTGNPRYTYEGALASGLGDPQQVRDLQVKLEGLKGIPLLPHYDREVRRAEKGKGFPPRACVARLKLKGRVKNAVWITVPFIMDRELPPDSIITKLKLKVDRIGTEPRYELQFTVESDTFRRAEIPNTRRVAVRPGWRLLPEGSIQVASVYDGEKYETLKLPPDMYESEKLSRRLKGYGDKHFDSAKAAVLDHFKTDSSAMERTQADIVAWRAAKGYQPLPDRKHIRHLHKWRSHARLANLAFVLCDKYSTRDRIRSLWAAWRPMRKQSELDLFHSFEVLDAWFLSEGVQDPRERVALYLEWWRRKDEHLWNWSCRLTRRLERRRLNIYRVFAARLERAYGYILVPAWDKQKAAKKPKPSRDTRTPHEEAANAIRQFCGVSVLGSALKHAAGKERIEEVPVGEISTGHYGCEDTAETDPELRATRPCTKCGRNYDRAANAALQLFCHGGHFPQAEELVAAE